MGSEPLSRHISLRGKPTGCSISFNLLAKEGGRLRSGRKEVKDKCMSGSFFLYIVLQGKKYSKEAFGTSEYKIITLNC